MFSLYIYICCITSTDLTAIVLLGSACQQEVEEAQSFIDAAIRLGLSPAKYKPLQPDQTYALNVLVYIASRTLPDLEKTLQQDSFCLPAQAAFLWQIHPEISF